MPTPFTARRVLSGKRQVGTASPPAATFANKRYCYVHSTCTEVIVADKDSLSLGRGRQEWDFQERGTRSRSGFQPPPPAPQRHDARLTLQHTQSLSSRHPCDLPAAAVVPSPSFVLPPSKTHPRVPASQRAGGIFQKTASCPLSSASICAFRSQTRQRRTGRVTGHPACSSCYPMTLQRCTTVIPGLAVPLWRRRPEQS